MRPGLVLHEDAFFAPFQLSPVLDLTGVKHLGEPSGGWRGLDELGELLDLFFKLVQGTEVAYVEYRDEDSIVVARFRVDAETQLIMFAEIFRSIPDPER